ncbi:UPF0592 membrane protein [Cercospora beticola]|uniref:UPF0592 membrane protein n=1 Tax=Cercospora beticola TaxID=122368 RepID=A0A2G5HZ91_CERBT|nr:UPF0592 membrane protein [Cercospora beticola]PIA97811.1 UPF0592 membrane protein [Cercospora beticola]WPA98506.1 hypothetical protein RHO25_003118 [Cercospora beticola]
MALAAADRVNFSRPNADVGQHGATGRERGNGRPRGASLTGRNVNMGNVTPDSNNAPALPRAASYTYLPDTKTGEYSSHAVLEIRGVAKEDLAAESDNDTVDISPSEASPPEDNSGWNTPEDSERHTALPRANDIAAQLRKSTGQREPCDTPSVRSSISTIHSAARESRASVESTKTASTAATTPSSSQRPSFNKSFSRRFSGKSWYPSSSSTPSSRSPSPTKVDSIVEQPIAESEKEETGDVTPRVADTGRRKSFQLRKKTSKSTKESRAKKERQDSLSSGDEKGETKPGETVARRGTLLRKKAARTSGLTQATNDGRQQENLPPSLAKAPAVPQLPKSFSTDRLPSAFTASMKGERTSPLPKTVSSEKHHMSPLSSNKKKDELWTQFRALDADFSKFESKSSALKANVVRNTLIPFLRTYSCHPSNKMLRPEDLDRRASIFNKWWTGLLEMLAGKNNQSISGTDRPVVLDGISGIMERPEWRLTPSPFCPLNERVKASMGNGSRSNTSLTSSSSDFLADSVHHNVRNNFIANLTSQMAFVVDKMSLRNASASLVTFCGKACAYAFVFVPGMADVLVRLWELPIDDVRRVLQENGISKFDHIPEHVSATIVPNFPPALQQLGFDSLAKFSRKMRTPPPLPVGTAHIQWWGHWVERWSGRESDLFYVFTKHYHILAVDFLPSNTTKLERICAPCMVPVHAQILANLELTIHRDANHAQQDLNAAPTPTFDDVLGDPNIHASSLPVPPTNAVRLMAENRLIMLIRDFLSERTADHPLARELFAQSFNDLLQAAARGTSMFDHSACYTMLDFLEEALVLLVRYDSLRSSSDSLVNSKFWQAVFKKMIESENTMTEIRLYAFLFTIWHVLIGHPDRKRDLCMDLLLEPDVFESRFNHWCPMVRAYYMRLLCWRLGRYDEEASLELDILETLQQRLTHTWSHYTYLRDKAEQENSSRPECYPCHPAPGRRLLIMRTDNIISPAGSLITFDGLIKDANIKMAKRTAAAPGMLENLDLRPDSSSSNMDSDQESNGKGFLGTLKKMIGGGAKKNASKTKSVTTTLRDSPHHTSPERTGKDVSSVVDSTESSPKACAEKPKHRSLSFKFSLEFHPSNKPLPPMRLFPPRLPGPAHRLLQERSDVVSQVGLPVKPRGASIARAKYAGRALAEWTIVVGEYGSFFDRRLKEGVPERKWVETPTLGVEVFKRPS